MRKRAVSMAAILAHPGPLWQFARRTARAPYIKGEAARADPPVKTSRRSSVVERVIGNDEVLSSILSGGTIKSMT